MKGFLVEPDHAGWSGSRRRSAAATGGCRWRVGERGRNTGKTSLVP
jgi:hypothetical protein